MRGACLLSLALLLIGGCQPATVNTTGPVRVVSLAPSLTEIIYALDAADCLAGRSSACKFPATATNIPVAGDFGVPALESIATLAPQIVLTVDMAEPNASHAIQRLGIRHVNIPCRTLDEIPAAIRTVGQLLQRDAAAAQLAGEFSAKLAALRAQPAPAHRPRVFVEVWGDPLMTTGTGSFLHELITLAGGDNIAADVERGFFQISPEAILARNPEVIVLLSATQPNFAARSGWANLAAIQSNRVCRDLDRDLLGIPGPRVLQGVADLRRCMGVVEPATRREEQAGATGGTPVQQRQGTGGTPVQQP